MHVLRTERKLSQDKLAKAVGVPRSTLAYWERSGNLRGRDVILKLAKAMGVSVEKLLRTDKPDREGK